MNPRHLSLAATALALALCAGAPAFAAPMPVVAAVTSVTGNEYADNEAVIEEDLVVSFTQIDEKDPDTSKGLEFDMFRDRTVAPGAYGQQDIVITNNKAEAGPVGAVITNGSFTGDTDWTDAASITWAQVDSATGVVGEPTTKQVRELQDADGNAAEFTVMSGTLQPGQSATIRISYEVPDGGNGYPGDADFAPYGNRAFTDETSFSFDVIVGYNPSSVPETPIDTGSGFGWMQNLDEPHTWLLAGVGALLAAAGHGFRHSLRSYIHSAPKETTS